MLTRSGQRSILHHAPYHARYARAGSYYSDTTSPASSTSPPTPTSMMTTSRSCLTTHTRACRYMRPWISPRNRKCSCSRSCQRLEVLPLDFGVVLRLTRVHHGFVRYFTLCTVSLLQYFSRHFLCWCNTHQTVLTMPPTHIAGAYLATVSHQREVGRVLMFAYWT